MVFQSTTRRGFLPRAPRLAALGILASAALIAMSCGKNDFKAQWNGQTASVVINVKDPPSCAAPAGNFRHVFVTLRSVQANHDPAAGEDSPGWQELAPQLHSAPLQVDLLAQPAGGCALAQLGPAASVPSGDYAQFRVELLSDHSADGPLPPSNACASLGHIFNCVVTRDGAFHALAVATRANVGLKIPPEQLLGGPVRLAQGQTTIVNIDFNTCASLVPEENGGYRLNPFLTAGQASAPLAAIRGQVIDSASSQPIAAGRVLVALEQAGNNGADRILMQTAADGNGNFRFCLLPTGTVFDVAVVGTDAAGRMYNPTIVLNVPGNAALGAIPLVASIGAARLPAVIRGIVAADAGASAGGLDIALSAWRTLRVSQNTSMQIAIPVDGNSTAILAVQSELACAGTDSVGAACANYKLVVPAGPPLVGSFSAGKMLFAPSGAAFDSTYSIEARSFAALSGGAPTCTPAARVIHLDASGQPLRAVAGVAHDAQEILFRGCK